MIEYLSVDLVIKIHDRESLAPLLEYGKLESAVLSPQTDYFGQVPYPTLFEKAAVLLSHIANAHAFLDGNKRCAWASCELFLLANGVELNLGTQSLVAFIEDEVVDNNLSVKEIAVWLSQRQA
ncbi:type II toxin-antitoxin system death-on-curing family toxin [Brevibacterium aurantiacum]|uniref:Type II toxin-antitoxin system death-on-curing family toxin n=1 Tax=Brevibacterium aurantiacum TaxID=273384 RepID=A0A3Q9NVQ5_BREAU|nr:type II toxin-antitoxin system death-on-curing family toxin [Brevibacterium aurantiacum]